MTQQQILPLVTSHSIGATFGHCARRFEFQHVYQTGAESSDVGLAAEAGTAIHEAVQAWALIALHPDADPEAHQRGLEAGMLALLRHWPWVMENLAVEDKKAAATQRSLSRAVRLTREIIESPFWHEWELAILSDGTPAIEIPWRITHTSLPTFEDHLGRTRQLVSQGKIDFILRHRRTGRFHVADLKTTIGADHSKFRFSGQGVQYAMVLGQMLGLPWREEGIDVTYLVGDFGTSERWPAVIPFAFHYSPDELDDMLRTLNLSHEMILRYGKEGWWPRRMHGCDFFQRPCQFMPICHRRDSKFIAMWLAFSDAYKETTRVYEPKWELEA